MLSLCMLGGCSENNEIIPTREITVTLEETRQETQEAASTEENFASTIEELPYHAELSPMIPSIEHTIASSDYFRSGVWLSEASEGSCNFYVFYPDGIHGELIPIADADGVAFTYRITGNKMLMLMENSHVPYNAELEKINDNKIVISMVDLGIFDELSYFSEIPEKGFVFYPPSILAKKAGVLFEDTTGVKPAGIDFRLNEDNLVIIDIWVKDSNGWREDIESYTVDMITGCGWSSISFDEIDLSEIEIIVTSEEAADDNIGDIEEPAE